MIAGAPGIDPKWYQKHHTPAVPFAQSNYALLKNAYAAIVTSHYLRDSPFGFPQMVCYKSSSLSYAIAKRIVQLDYISLVNLF